MPLLFSFSGEVDRQQFWIGGAAIGVIILLAMKFAGGLAIQLGAVLLVGWMTLALAIKRARARGRPLWWLLISLVPFVGAFWFMWEFGIRANASEPRKSGLTRPTSADVKAWWHRINASPRPLPKSIHLQKTKGLRPLNTREVLESGLREDVAQELGYHEREKLVHKGPNPAPGFKGAPACWFMPMNLGLVLLDKGKAERGCTRLAATAFDKTIGEIAGIAGIAGSALAGAISAVVDVMVDARMDKESVDAPFAALLARPGTAVLPYPDIIEVTRIRHTFADSALHIRRQTATGNEEEYWLAPAPPEFPALIMLLRAKAEKELIFQQLLAENADTSAIASRIGAEFCAASGGSIREADRAAVTNAYLRALAEQLTTNGTSFGKLYAEADRVMRETFEPTSVFSVQDPLVNL